MSGSNLTPTKIITIGAPSQTAFKDVIGQSPSMKRIFRIVEKVAGSDTTIMLTGETGTGKGVIAPAIHECCEVQPGMRLTSASLPGVARPLKTVSEEGVTIAESAPVIGIALSAPDENGFVWVLVNPQ